MFKRYKEGKEDRRLEREFDRAVKHAIENGYGDNQKYINIKDIKFEESEE